MESEYSNLEQTRVEKIGHLRSAGIEPYPARSEQTHTTLEARQAFETAETAGDTTPILVTLTGRLRAARPMGKIVFAHLEDRAGRMQLFFRANELGADQIDFFNREFDLGDFIQASGAVVRTRTGEITLQVSSFHMLAKSITPLPALPVEPESLSEP